MDELRDMDNEREELIRRRAYAIWEQEGRPDGQHQRHWEQAAREMQGPEMPGQETQRDGSAPESEVQANGSRRREKQTAAGAGAPASPEGNPAARPDGGR
ncbi:DUF2934 domain-containing protein [Sinorhizobium meliloti]|uniref:DUF2934 domain-containing protein n=1 Tax=Rhizobium meliloti TaxID=382 RepID=UPI0002F87E3E|nr:DUF2934 domain-containing protein [Sinorhizobium meliloti]ATA97225.1 hypothetical protein BWO76_13200 [Sinorhizobium meliloti]MDE3764296.1 DUF2934 domain-containing protein [Sinorhizobium meliloti]MDE3778063.1 DUF2934 domain-containing protein [Sinorhizobium meliloti]MDE3800787.1 DUF2934 domain-containing protein [Sinorhizobium meliloti]MDE3802246.1 DUF2934 domain-containing protein [Sinorhizobium meliloti]